MRLMSGGNRCEREKEDGVFPVKRERGEQKKIGRTVTAKIIQRDILSDGFLLKGRIR